MTTKDLVLHHMLTQGKQLKTNSGMQNFQREEQLLNLITDTKDMPLI